MNNRNFPPPPQQFRRPDMNGSVPARVIMGLISQSEKRYMFYREAAMKMEAGFGELELVFEGEPLDPMVREHLQYISGLGDYGKQDINSKMKYEMHLLEELRRLLMGRPSRAVMRRQPQLSQGSPPYHMGQMPPPGYGREQVPPGYGPQQMPQQMQPQPAQQIPVPEMPTGPIDYRDPKQAAAALLRAQPMPLGPAVGAGGMQPQQGGAYVPPGAYGVPQAQAAYGVPPGAYVPPPSQVPVVAGAPETATQIMQQSQPQPAVNIPPPGVPMSVSGPQQNGVPKNATS